MKLSALRGMPDFLPAETAGLAYIEAVWAQVVRSYAYQEIRLPLLEPTALFKRSIGDATDIVEKEMFTLQDRDGESISLRPEGTASCVRAALEHGLLYHQTPRLWYGGPMFRYERPQKGRYRQFYHLGIEAFGVQGVEIELEQLYLMARLWRALGLQDTIRLEINSLGSAEARARHRSKLVAYFTAHQAQLDEDCLRRLERNPLCILDSKNPQLQTLITSAPALADEWDAGEQEQLDFILRQMQAIGVSCHINHRLVRGLDYYTGLVYEWVTNDLGAQGTVCAGGRYDGLVTQLGGQATPAVGCALGLERIWLLLQTRWQAPAPIDIYGIAIGAQAQIRLQEIAEALRTRSPQVSILVHTGPGNLKQQFKRADQSGARLALVLGEPELEKGQVGIKFLREDRPQEWVAQTALVDVLVSERGV